MARQEVPCSPQNAAAAATPTTAATGGSPVDAASAPAAVTAIVREHLERARAGEETAGDPLTPREQEVIKLVAEGHTTDEIAEALHIAKKTVDRHRANILDSRHSQVGIGVASGHGRVWVTQVFRQPVDGAAPAPVAAEAPAAPAPEAAAPAEAE